MRQLAILLFAILICTSASAQEWTQHVIDPADFYSRSVYAADIDTDGDNDVLLGKWGVCEIQLWENGDGIGTDWIWRCISGPYMDGALDVYAADVDGDSDLDVLAAAVDTWESDGILLMENEDGLGFSWNRRWVTPYGYGGDSMDAVDMDLDGDIDILLGSFHPSWWENVTGLGDIWSGVEIVDNLLAHVSSISGADLDTDGDLDAVGTLYEIDEIRWWENVDGAATVWTEHVAVEEVARVWDVKAVDMDADGDVDLVGAVYDDDDIIWWENADGTGMSWFEHMVDGEFDGARSVHAADIDGDGDIDLVGAAYLGNEVTWWENIDGMGTTWIEHTLAGEFAYACDVYAEDMDGDGDLDVLGASSDGDGIAWWENPLITSVEDQTSRLLPSDFSFQLAYPNPFNPTAHLTVELPKPSELSVTAHNVSGQQVAELANGSYTAGSHRFTFDAANLASGLYFIRATVPGQLDQTQKLVLMR